MSRPKKPRNKQYKPRIMPLPLGMRDAAQMELPGYAASLALGMPHFCEDHVANILSSADMARRIAPNGHAVREVAQGMIVACAAIFDRAERLGKFGVTGDEMRTLRAGLDVTMAFLRGASNAAIARASIEAVREFDKYGALKV